jgi:hypothetical protein
MRKGWEKELMIPAMTLERLDWAARPTTIDAKPAATNIEEIIPKDPGKTLNVVAITPTITTQRTISLRVMARFVINLG